MAKYERILLATDFTEASKHALAEAIRVARRNTAQLHVLYVDVIAQQNLAGFDYPALPDYVRKIEQASMDAVGRDTAIAYKDAVTAVVRDHSEAAGILRYAKEKSIDLIVVGTHGRGPIPEMFLGSVAQAVVSQAPVPVLVVGAQHVASPPAGGRPVILAPVDFTDACGRALKRAGAMAIERDAHLVVMHVVDGSRIAYRPDLPAAHAEEEARDRLEQFVAAAGLPVEPELMVGIGHPDDVIFDLAAKRSAGLILISPSSHGVLDRLLLGSVTKRIVRGAPCPVLIHREPQWPGVQREAA